MEETFNEVYFDETGTIVTRADIRAKTVVIPMGITKIGDYAFDGCFLNKITIPDTVIELGQCAFGGCHYLESIEIPNSVQILGDGIFADCINLKSIEIPDSVTIIGEEAFANCQSIKELAIPYNVSHIGSRAFAGAYKLENIYVDERNKDYKDIQGCLYSKDGKCFIKYPTGKKNEMFTIPDGVESICKEAFEFCCSLSSVVVPDSVKYIGEYSFDGVKEVHLKNYNPESLEVNENAFSKLYSKLYVPIGTGYAYRHDSRFKNVKEILTEK